MSEDITVRLRKPCGDCTSDANGLVIRCPRCVQEISAADEIERLRKEYGYKVSLKQSLQEEVATLKCDNERLRERLAEEEQRYIDCKSQLRDALAELTKLREEAQINRDLMQDVKDRESEIERLRDTEKRLIEHLDAKTGDCVQDEQWDDVWHLAHPNDSSWEYPGQVIREVRAAFGRLREQLADSVSPETLMSVECERNEAREAAKWLLREHLLSHGMSPLPLADRL